MHARALADEKRRGAHGAAEPEELQRDDQFFVGCVLYTAPGRTGQEYISGLELLSGNHTWHPFSRLRFWKRTDPARN